MAWSAAKNRILFQRLQNVSAAIVNILEERDRLLALYTNEANGDPAFVDTEIATVQEATQLVTKVLNPLDALINNEVVSQEERMQYLTPFLADQQ